MVTVASCHETPKKITRNGDGKDLTIALAGNANVGKSVIFNQLTGSHQIIGNWPGKTVERAEGSLSLDGHDIRIVDLPGIYSMSTFSLEELVSRDYIAHEKPDVVINVIGAAVLERNLFFTLQLIEMGVPLVVCLNQIDVAESKGITIDYDKLANLLGVPVVPTIAAKGEGVKGLVDRAIQVANGVPEQIENSIRYSDGVEEPINEIVGLIKAEHIDLKYYPRWVAIKLLEGDAAIKDLVGGNSANIVRASETLAKRMEEAYGQPSFVVIASERYSAASQIAGDVQKHEPRKLTFLDRLDLMSTHKVFGYIVSAAVIGGLLLWTFIVGNFLSNRLSHFFSFFQRVDPQTSGALTGVLWNGVFGGFVAGVTLVVPYVVPFYLMLAALEDSGILTRVAFMMDSAMHKIGLHGKAIIPIILGYGCNVPAIYSTRIMANRRERLLTAFAITFAPCPARTVVILGLVAAFLGIWWALAVYLINILIMFVMVKLASKAIPGDLTGMIMEMHSFKKPSLSITAKQTWSRTRSLIYMVFPIYMISSAAVQAAYALGWLVPVNNAISFLTVSVLGLPVIAGTFLIFGAARKELTLLMAVAIFGANLALHLNPSQLLTLALVATIYPCMATIGTLTKEFGWKPAWGIIGASLTTTVLVGAVAARVLPLVV